VKEIMRYAFFIAAAALCAGAAFAEEPAACYIARDPTGDFVPGIVQTIDADVRIAAQVTHLMNQSNRAAAKCMEGHVRREGMMPNGAVLRYGARISPAGKVTQVSVLEAQNLNDAMLMACLARTICQWELEPDAEGRERLIVLPSVTTRERVFTRPGR
jgi:hypothetical protein